jgi:hypothetical protein
MSHLEVTFGSITLIQTRIPANTCIRALSADSASLVLGTLSEQIYIALCTSLSISPSPIFTRYPEIYFFHYCLNIDQYRSIGDNTHEYFGRNSMRKPVLTR